MTRIIAGHLKNRTIKIPKQLQLRPTQDKIKEAIFSILHDVTDKTVLDLFAGTGNLGFEALSRGAVHCTFVDNHRRHLKTIQENAIILKITDSITLINSDVVTFLHSKFQADLIFADPPYNYRQFDKLFKAFTICSPESLIILEASKSFLPPADFRFSHYQQKIIGDTSINIIRI
jgi:16S rRNA (guanine966-N2)-methyltransferase